MKEKIKWIILNVVTFILIVVLLCLPLFTLEELGESPLDGKVVYGFHFVTGLMTKNPSNQDVQVIASKLSGLIPTMMLLSMFIIDKATKVKIGKDIVNFLCSFVVVLYILVLPVISPTFLNELYSELVEFNIYWGYWIALILAIALFAYYTVIMIFKIIEFSKELKAKENS